MSSLYFDCFSGVSGDMLVAALLDCGVPLDYLRSQLDKLSVDIQITARNLVIQGISCTAFQVEAGQGHPLRHIHDIEKILSTSNLPIAVINKSMAIFQRLAAAEANVHSVLPAKVHFHEIGAVDTIVDIVGTFLCLDYLNIESVYTSPLPWSRGFVNIAHGCYPLPAPATALLLEGFPCTLVDADCELVTPTGAALITSMAVPLPSHLVFIPEQVAYGAGQHERQDNVPNLLRVVKIRTESPMSREETVAVIETEVDDLNPEVFSHLYSLFIAHPDVLDFFTSQVFMKKNRPGILITIITRPDSLQNLASLLMLESGSLGVRYRFQPRLIAPRSETTIESPWGPVRVKVAQLTEGNSRFKPEFEDCQAIANKHNIPLLQVYTEINQLILQQL